MEQALKSAEVEYIVAPYEADAQMAFLALNGQVHAVITEDSDLLAYGCPRVSLKWGLFNMFIVGPDDAVSGSNSKAGGISWVFQVLYKLDKSGEGQQICREDFDKSKGLSFTGFTDDMFLEVGGSVDSTKVGICKVCYSITTNSFV